MNVRIQNGALDEYEGHIVLRGIIVPETLEFLRVDDYQRSIQPVCSLARIMKGFQKGSAIPDIELGMRGHRKTVRDGVYTLLDDVYIIDGLQRVSAAKLFMANGGTPHLGASIHFDTTKEWEKNLFKILNADRTRVASNVILRNFKDDWSSVQSLFLLTTTDKGFPLQGKVCWEQSGKRGDLITGILTAKTVLTLHSHLSGLSSCPARVEKICEHLQALEERVGRNVLRGNVRTFFQFLDDCWQLNNIRYVGKAVAIKATFLLTVAKVVSNHEVFWEQNRLQINADLKRKFASFPTFDPTVGAHASSGTKVHPELYRWIVDHLNKGRRNRLQERQKIEIELEDPEVLPPTPEG